MRAIHRKLVRDLWRIKGQVLAISLVIAAAVAVYVMYLSAFDSLRLTQDTYYDRSRFADVFASLKRAPMHLEPRILEIPGVAAAELRVTAGVTLDIEGMVEPAVGRFVGIPPERRAMLNDIFIRRGRYIDAARRNEILVNEGFALAHDLQPGDTIAAVINGRRRELQISGIALSPEYLYTIRPGEVMPDDRRYGIIWMNQHELAAAFDLEGGFNDVALRLMAGASVDDVLAHLDRLLERYGGLGAIPRSLQLSHWFLNNELTQLQSFGTIIPIIFLAVAGFLLNVVLSRIVAVQREQIAALKALGYTNFEIGLHYYLWSLLVAVIGATIGVACGVWMASGMVVMYNDFFRFPSLEYRILPQVIVVAVVTSFLAALLGARGAVVRAVRLPPAEAMRPQSPQRYHVSLLERTLLGRWLSPPSRIIVRNLSRRPYRSALSAIGIAFGAAMMIVGMFFLDSMNYMMDVQFNVAQRHDVTVMFVEPASRGAFFELAGLDAVMDLESVRSVPARLRFGPRNRTAAITGLVEQPRLNRIINAELDQVYLPAGGIVLSATLADVLHASEGDVISVEVLEGTRPVRDIQVTDVVDEFMGMSAYMDVSALHQLMREGPVLSGAYLQVDAAGLDALYTRLKATPSVAAVSLKDAAIRSFEDTIEQNMGLIIFFNQVFSSTIAFGVIYNAARISLSERSWELASLRVLGFTRGEISYILLGEFAVLTAAAIPLGMLIGYGLAAVTVMSIGTTELYRIPLVIGIRTYALSALGVMVAALVSALVVGRRLNRLDLVAVLKTRE